MDSALVISLIHSEKNGTGPHYALICGIKDLMNKPWRVKISHVFREGNQAADWLSTLAFTLSFGMHKIDSPPPEISNILIHDANGVGYLRRKIRLEFG